MLLEIVGHSKVTYSETRSNPAKGEGCKGLLDLRQKNMIESASEVAKKNIVNWYVVNYL